MMKAKLSFLLLFCFSFFSMTSQVPQGFNYQALALDVSGNPLVSTSLNVKVGVTTDMAGTIYVWEEQHNNVTTNSQGLFSLVFGNPLATKTGGTAVSFALIDWSSTPLFITTKIFYGSMWHEMGTAQLWSVPYSMVSGRTTDFDNYFTLNGDTVVLSRSMSIGSPEPGRAMLAVTGRDDTSEDPLFEVKRKDGQTVFAVYSEGVRINVGEGGSKALKGGFAIGGFDESKGMRDLFVVNSDCVRVYIDDNADKALKGGFAIGSFDLSKGTGQDYLSISKDSIRMYIDDTDGGKAVKGGFAIGGFDLSKSGNNSFLNVATDASGVINPSQNRMLWYPLADKNAFFVGRVLIELPDSVGVNSVTTGFESRAKGNYSQAFGYKAIARGLYSTAIGKGAVAHRDNSFAFGENAYAGGVGSFALGVGSTASGLGSFALGFEGRDSTNSLTGATVASGTYSMAFGMGAVSRNTGSLAVGTMAEANFEYSTAIGYQTVANNWYATAVGYRTEAIGKFSSAFGFRSIAIGESSVALGRGTAGGKLSAAMGASYAGGTYSVAMGNASAAHGYTSIAAGHENSAVGNYSAAFGAGTFSNGTHSFSSGYATIAEADYSNAIGLWNIGFKVLPSMNITDPQFNALLEVGNGSGTSRSNAMTVLRNGQVLVGTHDGEFIEEQTMYNDPPHTMNIKGRKPWTDEGYFGLFVHGQTMIEGDIVPGSSLSSIGSSTEVWKSVYASDFYGNGTVANFYANLIPNGTRSLGNASYRWNYAYINNYYGNSSNNATFFANLIPNSTGTRNLGSSTLRWSTAYINTYYGNSSNNAVFAAALLPSGTRTLGSTAAYWSSIYGRQMVLDGSSGLTELVFTKSGSYSGAVGYNHTGDYLYLYKGDNLAVWNGRVGIGTTTPGYKLTVNGNAYCSSGLWTGSDLQWKKNIMPIQDVLSDVLQLQGVLYEWRTEEYPLLGFDDLRHIGFIAQEVEDVFPLLVRTDDAGKKSVAYDKLTAVLVEAVKEQQQIIDNQRNEIDALKAKNKEIDLLRAEIEAIKAVINSNGAR